MMKRNITKFAAFALVCVLLVGVLLSSFAEEAEAVIQPDLEIEQAEEAAPEAEPEAETEPAAETEIVIEAEPAAEAEPTVEAEPVAEAEPAAETEAEAEPVSETEPAAETEPETETEPEITSEPETVPTAEPETETEPEPETETVPESETETVPETETVAETETVGEPEAEPETEPETEAKAEPETVEPVSEPVAVPEAENEPETVGEKPEEIETPAIGRLWITLKDADRIVIGDQIILKANVENGSADDAVWETLTIVNGEEKWTRIGSSRELKLDVTAEDDGAKIRFILADGTASEIYVIRAEETETAEETVAEVITETEETETAAEPETTEEPEAVVRYVVAHSSLEGRARVCRNDDVTLTAELFGYEGVAYTVQWKYSADGGATWTAVEGANSLTYVYQINETNLRYAWSVEVTPAEG